MRAVQFWWLQQPSARRPSSPRTRFQCAQFSSGGCNRGDDHPGSICGRLSMRAVQFWWLQLYLCGAFHCVLSAFNARSSVLVAATQPNSEYRVGSSNLSMRAVQFWWLQLAAANVGLHYMGAFNARSSVLVAATRSPAYSTLSPVNLSMRAVQFWWLQHRHRPLGLVVPQPPVTRYRVICNYRDRESFSV